MFAKKAVIIPIANKIPAKNSAFLYEILPLGIGLSDLSFKSILESKTSFNVIPPAYNNIDENIKNN